MGQTIERIHKCVTHGATYYNTFPGRKQCFPGVYGFGHEYDNVRVYGFGHEYDNVRIKVFQINLK